MKKQITMGAALLFTAGAILMTGCKKEDTTAPTITLTGGTSVQHILNATWTEPGYSAEDDEDGNLTASVTISGTVNKDLKGTYTLTYSVTDAAGNEGTASRTVTVYNEADILTGNYNVNESCSVTPAFTYTPSITSSNSVNKQFSISNWGGFYPSQCTSAPVAVCNISGTSVNSTISWSGFTLCGNATVDGSAAFGGGSLTNASTPLQMTISYRWTDGSSTETCTGMYTKQ